MINLDISFAEWLSIGLPAVAILLPVLFVLLRLLAKPGEVPQFKVEAQAFKFNTARYLTLGIFFSAICGWLFSAPLAALFGIAKSFDTLVAICALLLSNLSGTFIIRGRMAYMGTHARNSLTLNRIRSDLIPRIRMPPTSFCRSCTPSCASWRAVPWAASGPITRCRRRLS